MRSAHLILRIRSHTQRLYVCGVPKVWNRHKTHCGWALGLGNGLAAQTSPVNIDVIDYERRVVQLKDNQQEHEEKNHEYAHYWGCAPAWRDFSVLRIQGLEDIAQLRALCHELIGD